MKLALHAALLAVPLLVAPPTSVPAPAQLAQWRAQMRHTLFVPDQLPPLEAKVWSTFSPVAGVLADRVTYRTADGMLVPAIVYRPEHWTGQDRGVKLPGIVLVNGHSGDKYTWYAFYSGILFARAGAEVVTYDPIGEGERNTSRLSHTNAHDQIQPAPFREDADAFHERWGRHLAGLMQVDLMQAVSYLDGRPEVDRRRIAVLGYSMGAFVAGISGAIDTRIHAVLLSGGGTFDDQADGGKSYDVGTLPCQAAPWRSLRVLGEEFHQRGAILYALNAQRGPMLVENGSIDTVMDIPHRGPEWFAALRAQASTLDQQNGVSTRDMFTTHVDPGKSHRPAWVERPGVEWLDQQIHFSNWTPAQIADMPTTRISQWASANHVDLSKGNQAEDREGGLDALGTGFPGLSRDQLTVLSDMEWQHHALELTYDAWAAKTLAATIPRSF